MAPTTQQRELPAHDMMSKGQSSKELRQLSERQKVQRQLREHPLLGLFSQELQHRIMSQDGSIREMSPMFGRLMVLAKRHPERMLQQPQVAELDRLRLHVRKSYFAAVKTLEPGSWYDRLLQRPVSVTMLEMYGRDGTLPDAALRILRSQLTGSVQEFLRNRSEVLSAKGRTETVSPTKDRSAADRRARQLARSTAGPAKGVNPQPPKFGQAKKPK